MNLIDTNIKPDPFDPQRGDVYESGGPFPQRIVVEIPPRSEDQRIRYRVDGGADSNLTTLGQFHLHLAGLGEIRGVGRVREYSPITPDEIRMLVHGLRGTALGVDKVAGDLMRGAAATIVEQAAKLEEMHKRFSAHERALVTLGFPPGEDPEQWASRVHYDQGYQAELNHRLKLQESLAEMRDGLLAAEQKIRKTPLAYNDSTEPLAVARRIVDEVTTLRAGLAEAEANNAELAKFVQAHGEPVPVDLHPFANLSIADIGHAAWLCGYHPGNDPMEVFKLAACRAQEWLEIEELLVDDLKTAREEDPACTVKSLVESLRDGYQQIRIKNDHLIADKAEQENECERLGKLLIETAGRFSVLTDAVAGSVQNAPRSDANLISIATNARQVSDQVRGAIRLLGFEWDDSKADAGHALIEAVRAERKVASDLALELDSISAFIAPHGVTMPAGSGTKPTSLDLVRWLAVTGGVVPHACHPTLAEVQEAQEVDFRARWDRYASTKREPAFGEPARPEVGEVDHFPSVAETRALGLRAEVHRTVAQLRDLSLNSQWPIRERLQSAAAVMLAVLRERDLVNAATLCTLHPGGVNESADPRSNPLYCTGFVTILAVKDRQIVQRQSWTSDRPDFKPTDVSFHDDDPRFASADALAFGDLQGTWTWQGRCYFADKQQWQGEWTEEKT